MAGEQQLPRAVHDGRFRMHHDAPSLCPGQTRGYTNLITLLLNLGQILAHAQRAMHIASMDVEGLFLPLGHLARDLPANGGEFTFEIPHPCLTGVGGDNVGNSRLREAYMLRYEPMLAQLAWQQIAP